MSHQLEGYRGKAYHCLGINTDEWLDDALLIFNPSTGEIEYFGLYSACPESLLTQTSVTLLKDTQLITPGLIDLHVHLPQLMVTGCQAPTLLDWLKTYIFKEEERFSDSEYAQKISQLFFDSLLQNGTTTAGVFLTTHTQAAEIAFETALKTGNRVIMGLNLMDKDDPNHSLNRPTEPMLEEAEKLCQKWHGKDNKRIQYAWMPRFALTSSNDLLEKVGKLRQKYPDTYFHTHLSEQADEVKSTEAAFPEASDYTDVYNRHGLLGKRSILAHCIHLTDSEKETLKEKECVIAHCPGSNFFLKSGRFPLKSIIEKNIHTGLGSDVGAGPELSIFSAMRDAQYTQEDWLVPLNTLFYLATLGAAKGLMMDNVIGNLAQGKQADFLILDLSKIQQKNSQRTSEKKEDVLSALIYHGTKAIVQKTYIQGHCVFSESRLPAAV